MHQPDTAPRHSIFYRYRVFPFVPPPRPQPRVPVVIVGAGPIGLACALDLARYGVRCVLLTAEQQVSHGSRALAYTRRSMEILQQVGVAERIQQSALQWRYGTSFYRGQPVYRMDMPYDEDDRFLPGNTLQQQFLEEYLIDRIAAEPLIDLRWGHKVVELLKNVDSDGDGDGGGARLRVDTPAGPYSIDCDWVLATDGARSTLRQALGLRMAGAAYEGSFLIADIRIDLPYPTERRCYFDPEWNPGNTVLMHREPHGLWRIDYQLPRGETAEEALRPAAVRSRIDAQLAMIGHPGLPWEMDWCSVYAARAMTLAEYVHRRVIFAGDAAHLLPIFGVRGANTGWQDGHDVVWKLAMAVRGLAGPKLLGSYSLERVAAAREVIAEASKSTRFMTPPSHGFKLLRNAALSLALTQDFVRPLLYWRTSRPHDYADSPLNAPNDDDRSFNSGPAKGQVIRNVLLAPGRYLMDLLGASFHLFWFGAENGIPESVAEAAGRIRAGGVPLAVVAIRRRGSGSVDRADLVVDDPAGRMHARYGVNGPVAAYLVRPDQHVCARWLTPDASSLTAAIDQALGRR